MLKLLMSVTICLVSVVSFAEEFEAKAIAEAFLKKVEKKVTVNGLHVTYDDRVPQFIRGKFNPKKIWGVNETWEQFVGRCKGTPTIGYGTTNNIAVKMKFITEEDAIRFLKQDINLVYSKLCWKYEPHFTKLNSYQQAALISYHYNCGYGKHPKLYKLLGSNPSEAWREMDAGYHTAKRNGISGIIERRHAEWALYKTK